MFDLIKNCFPGLDLLQLQCYLVRVLRMAGGDGAICWRRLNLALTFHRLLLVSIQRENPRRLLLFLKSRERSLSVLACGKKYFLPTMFSVNQSRRPLLAGRISVDGNIISETPIGCYGMPASHHGCRFVTASVATATGVGRDQILNHQNPS